MQELISRTKVAYSQKLASLKNETGRDAKAERARVTKVLEAIEKLGTVNNWRDAATLVLTIQHIQSPFPNNGVSPVPEL